MDDHSSTKEAGESIASPNPEDFPFDTSKAAQSIQKSKRQLSQNIKEKLHDSEFTASVDRLPNQDDKDRETDRELKTMYAKRFMWILIGQLVAMNIIFIFTGLGKLNFSHWALELYMGGTLAEVFGIVFVITRHLFPTKFSFK